MVWSRKLIVFSSLDCSRRYGNTISKDKLTWAPYNTVVIISGTRVSPRLEISAPKQGWNTDSFLRSSNLYHVEKVERKVGRSHIIWKPILETFLPPTLPCLLHHHKGIYEKDTAWNRKDKVTCIFNFTPNRSEQTSCQTAPPFHLQNLAVFRKCCSLNFKGIER